MSDAEPEPSNGHGSQLATTTTRSAGGTILPERFGNGDIITWLRQFNTCATANNWNDGDKLKKLPLPRTTPDVCDSQEAENRPQKKDELVQVFTENKSENVSLCKHNDEMDPSPDPLYQKLVEIHPAMFLDNAPNPPYWLILIFRSLYGAQTVSTLPGFESNRELFYCLTST